MASAPYSRRFLPSTAAAKRFVEFFTVNIRNPNTRKVYARAVAAFSVWCEGQGLHKLQDIEPVHGERLAIPS